MLYRHDPSYMHYLHAQDMKQQAISATLREQAALRQLQQGNSGMGGGGGVQSKTQYQRDLRVGLTIEDVLR
jgi:hypothetical protein